MRGGAGCTLVAAVIELVARAVLAPASVGILDACQPGNGFAEFGRGMIEVGGIERAKDRPGAINVIHAPAAVPAALRGLRAAQIIKSSRDCRAICLADLREHANAARRHVLGRRIEQCAMIGERNVVEVIIFVLGIERAPSPIGTLHSQNPCARRLNRLTEIPVVPVHALGAVHCHHHDRRVVNVGIMGIRVLERPAAGIEMRSSRAPIALDVQNLSGGEPGKTLADLVDGAIGAGFQQGMTGEPGIPNRRHAGLAIGFVIVDDQELLDRVARNPPPRLGFAIAERVEHHDAVRHGRENRP